MKAFHFFWCIIISSIALAGCDSPQSENVTPTQQTQKTAPASTQPSTKFDQWIHKGKVVDFKDISASFNNAAEAFNALIYSGYDVIIDFYATWCGPCKNMAPSFEAVARQFPDKLFVKIDINIFESLASQAHIMSIPAIKLFKNGLQINSTVGQKSEAELKQLIQKTYSK